MKKEPFGAQLLHLPQIFAHHFFVIPDYQRGYAWESKQVQEMLTDIDHLMRDDQILRHYTGTLVLSRPPELAASEFHVVDGQQRLTTLVIIMACLSQWLADEEKQKCIATYIQRGDLGSERFVLTPNSDTRLFFERVTLGNASASSNPITLEAHARLVEAKRLINEWLKKTIKDNVSASDIKNTIEKELGFLVYAPAEDAETGIMFEVINNRGKELSELEKVKNYLIYCAVKLSATTLRDDINADWSGILGHLNIAKKTTPSDEGAFLRYCSVVFFGLNKSDSQYGYDQIKKIIDIGDAVKDKDKRQKAIKQIQDFVVFMKNASLWYARLYGRVHDNLNKKIIPILDQLRAQDRHASIMPIFLALVIKEESINEKILRLLKLLEILNFRVYMAVGIAPRTDSGQADLYWFATKYYYGQLFATIPDKERIVGKQKIVNEYDAMEYKLTWFINWYSADSLFIDSFELDEDDQFDFYDWAGLRYFLMCYEENLQPNKTIQIDKITKGRAQGKSADYLSIEHVWAKENRNSEGENNRKVDSHEKRRLGNFVLLELRLNIQGGYQGIEDKLPMYLGKIGEEPPTDLMQVRMLDKDAKNSLRKFSNEVRSKNYYVELYRHINDKQEKRFTDFAMNRWSIKEYLGYEYLMTLNEEDEE